MGIPLHICTKVNDEKTKICTYAMPSKWSENKEIIQNAVTCEVTDISFYALRVPGK